MSQEDVLFKEIQTFEDQMQNMVDAILAQYESFMRNERNVKTLLENIGEIPSIKRPDNEHKTDA